MSIKIEVTGGSIGEVADKLLAIGHSLQGAAVTFNPVMPEIEAAEKPKATRKTKKAEPEVEQAAAGEPATAAAETVSSPSDTATAQPEANESSEISKSTDASTASSASVEPAAPALDFDKHVGPVVVEAVTTHGREAVVAVLNQFGAERASEVPEGQWAELVEALKAL